MGRFHKFVRFAFFLAISLSILRLAGWLLEQQQQQQQQQERQNHENIVTDKVTNSVLNIENVSILTAKNQGKNQLEKCPSVTGRRILINYADIMYYSSQKVRPIEFTFCLKFRFKFNQF